MKFPEHKCELSLTHNEHRSSYQTVAEFIESIDLASDFDSPEEMAKAIETDEIWVLQWYPETPIGFNRRAAATLAGLHLDD